MAAIALVTLGFLATPTFGSVALSSPESTECLRWQGEGGCESIQTEEECLSRRDGRPWAQWEGLLIAGQPCSWCGGERCANNSDAVCMPYDWVRHRVNISTANCSKGEPLKAWSSQAPANATEADGEQEARFEEPANGTRCGASRMDESKAVNKYYWTFTAASSEECRAICSARPFCTGFGFEARQQVCKAWWHPIDTTETSDHGGDACARAVNKSVVELQNGDDQQLGDEQQVMFQNSDDPQGNATGPEARAGMSDQEKAAIAGGVVGGAAAAGLLGGLLGGLLPQHAASSTTTAAAEILRMLEDNDTDAVNDTNESPFLGAAGPGGEGAGIPAWAWWLLAAVVALAAAACLILAARPRGAEEATSDSDDDIESLTARCHLAAAEQEAPRRPPTLLSRPAAAKDHKVCYAAGVEPRGLVLGEASEPVQAVCAAAPLLGGAATPTPPRFAGPASSSAGPVVSSRFFEPMAAPPRPPPPPRRTVPLRASGPA